MHARNPHEKFAFRKNAKAKRKIYISKRHRDGKKGIRERRANDRFRLLNNKRRAKSQKLHDKIMNLKLKRIKEEHKLLKLNVNKKNTKRKKA